MRGGGLAAEEKYSSEGGRGTLAGAVRVGLEVEVKHSSLKGLHCLSNWMTLNDLWAQEPGTMRVTLLPVQS
ncbi:hypothetical protein AOLI_G00163210 [Acnodon oligacanthus]